MREQLLHRLNELQQERERGEAILLDLDRKHCGLRDSLLRISGAIQVLKEELSGASETERATGECAVEESVPA